MRIYFSGSIRGGRSCEDVYLKIINCLKKYGEVLTEHVGRKETSYLGEKGMSDEDIYNRDISLIKEADVLVAEVSTPSLGVGYEIAKAEELGKSILCLYDADNKNVSAMVKGNKNILLKEYCSSEELCEHIDNYFNKL